MSRPVKKYSPTGEQKDYHDLVRIVQRIRLNDRRPIEMRAKMLHHGAGLLKLFASDETLGVPDPELDAEEDARQARSDRLDEEVRRREGIESHEQSAPELPAVGDVLGLDPIHHDCAEPKRHNKGRAEIERFYVTEHELPAALPPRRFR